MGRVSAQVRAYGGAQDTFDVGTLKGVGRMYQQTFLDTYSQVAWAKRSDRKPSLTAAAVLNDHGVPCFAEQEVPVSRMLTDRGPEYGGSPESQE